MEQKSNSPTLRKRTNPTGTLEHPPPYENLYPNPNVAESQTKGDIGKRNGKTAVVVPLALPNSHIQYGPERQRAVCPHCHARITTDVKATPTTMTHMAALLLFCFICWPCAWLPYCVDSCQNLNHYCPNCDAYLGTYES